jgi:flagellar motor switch/type III secretory pathway protein FliN
MATDQQTGTAEAESLQRAAAPRAGEQDISVERALVQLPPEVSSVGAGAEQSAFINRIPIEIDVTIPIRQFQVRNVLALAVGQVIATRWMEGEDVPLAAHGTQLAWTEIEVIDQKLAVRITRLA